MFSSMPGRMTTCFSGKGSPLRGRVAGGYIDYMRHSSVLALLAFACSDPGDIHTPNLADPMCFRSVVEVVTAGEDECVRLEAQNGDTAFTSSGEACGGAQCLRLEPGESAYVSTSVDRADHYRWRGPCADVTACP